MLQPVKMKQISPEQIDRVLKTAYATSISARDFDALKAFLLHLPDVPEKECVPEPAPMTGTAPVKKLKK